MTEQKFVFISEVKQLSHIFKELLEHILNHFVNTLYSVFPKMSEYGTISCLEQVPVLLLEVWSSNLHCKITRVFCICILFVKQKSWGLKSDDKSKLWSAAL